MKLIIFALIMVNFNALAQGISDENTKNALSPQEQVESERRETQREEEMQKANAIKPGPYDKDGKYHYDIRNMEDDTKEQ